MRAKVNEMLCNKYALSAHYKYASLQARCSAVDEKRHSVTPLSRTLDPTRGGAVIRHGVLTLVVFQPRDKLNVV